LREPISWEKGGRGEIGGEREKNDLSTKIPPFGDGGRVMRDGKKKGPGLGRPCNSANKGRERGGWLTKKRTKDKGTHKHDSPIKERTGKA